MTTPQNQLYNLAEQIKRLCYMFEPRDYDDDNHEETVFEAIKEIRKDVTELKTSYLRQEDQLALIIKLMVMDNPARGEQ